MIKLPPAHLLLKSSAVFHIQRISLSGLLTVKPFSAFEIINKSG